MTPAQRGAQLFEPSAAPACRCCGFRQAGVLAAGEHENRGAKLTTSAKARAANLAMSECASERASE